MLLKCKANWCFGNDFGKKYIDLIFIFCNLYLTEYISIARKPFFSLYGKISVFESQQLLIRNWCHQLKVKQTNFLWKHNYNSLNYLIVSVLSSIWRIADGNRSQGWNLLFRLDLDLDEILNNLFLLLYVVLFVLFLLTFF